MADCDILPSVLPPLVFSLSVTSATSSRAGSGSPETRSNASQVPSGPPSPSGAVFAENISPTLQRSVASFPAELVLLQVGRYSPYSNWNSSPGAELLWQEQGFRGYPESPEALRYSNENSPPADFFSPREDLSLALGSLLSPGSEDSSAGERVSLAVPLPYDRGMSLPRWAGILLPGVATVPRDDLQKSRAVLAERRMLGEARVRPAPEGMPLPCSAIAVALGGAMLSCGSMPRTLSLTAGSEAAAGPAAAGGDEGTRLAGDGAVHTGTQRSTPQAERMFFPCQAMALACSGAVVSCGGIPRTLSQTSAAESMPPQASDSEVSDDTSDGLMAMSDASGLLCFESRCPLPTISE